jgi:hypothetical protein
MAKQLNLVGSITRVIDGSAKDSDAFALLKTYARIARLDVTLTAAASETSYLPAGITTIDLIYVQTKDEIIKVRTVAAGTLFDVGPGVPFLAITEATAVDDLLITAHASIDSDVSIFVAQIT